MDCQPFAANVAADSFPHADTARSMALLPEESCPLPCARCAADTVGYALHGGYDDTLRRPEWWAILEGPDGHTLASYAAACYGPINAAIASAIAADEWPFARADR